jgi:S1-C subfamily serine protease
LSVPIARNGSGGPIFDAEGNVVGMATTQHAYGAGLEIAIPGEAIAEAQALAQAPLA